jgi:hypothetical protein
MTIAYGVSSIVCLKILVEVLGYEEGHVLFWQQLIAFYDDTPWSEYDDGE